MDNELDQWTKIENVELNQNKFYIFLMIDKKLKKKSRQKNRSTELSVNSGSVRQKLIIYYLNHR